MKSIHGKDIKIFACNSNKKLAQDIAAYRALKQAFPHGEGGTPQA